MPISERIDKKFRRRKFAKFMIEKDKKFENIQK